MTLDQEISEIESKSGIKAFVLIDMQDYFLEEVEPDNVDYLISRQKEVIDICKTKDHPVVVVNDFMGGKLIKDIDDSLYGLKRYMEFEKTDDSAFMHYSVKDALQAEGIQDVLLSGVFASACVLSSAEEAKKYFDVYTSKDLMADRADSKWLNDAYRWYENNITLYDNYIDFFRD